MLTRIYHPENRNERCAIGGVAYQIDASGHADVHPQHALMLKEHSGYEIVQEGIEVEVAQVRGKQVQLPKTPVEFVDLVLSIGLSAKDLRDIADMLDPPTRVSVVPSHAAPLPKAIGDKPEETVKISGAAVKGSADEETADEETEEEDAAAPRQLPAGLPAELKLSMPKKDLLAIGQQIKAPVSPDMNKRDIFSAIRSFVVQEYGQLV